MKTIALIDYGSGNLHSAARALRVAANNAKKTREIRITADPSAIAYADRIVLPGVGHFGDHHGGDLKRVDLILSVVARRLVLDDENAHNIAKPLNGHAAEAGIDLLTRLWPVFEARRVGGVFGGIGLGGLRNPPDEALADLHTGAVDGFGTQAFGRAKL